ncbi:hypothetical protein [Ureaplasma ceti]|uniref:Exonuclease domain-containing protein n=1 Tax=Ureaplasma ceti TaxID=3119530 RepID=A0ABP9UDH2_9BACT
MNTNQNTASFSYLEDLINLQDQDYCFLDIEHNSSSRNDNETEYDLIELGLITKAGVEKAFYFKNKAHFDTFVTNFLKKKPSFYKQFQYTNRYKEEIQELLKDKIVIVWGASNDTTWLKKCFGIKNPIIDLSKLTSKEYPTKLSLSLDKAYAHLTKTFYQERTHGAFADAKAVQAIFTIIWDHVINNNLQALMQEFQLAQLTPLLAEPKAETVFDKYWHKVKPFNQTNNGSYVYIINAKVSKDSPLELEYIAYNALTNQTNHYTFSGLETDEPDYLNRFFSACQNAVVIWTKNNNIKDIEKLENHWFKLTKRYASLWVCCTKSLQLDNKLNQPETITQTLKILNHLHN